MNFPQEKIDYAQNDNCKTRHSDPEQSEGEESNLLFIKILRYAQNDE